MSIQQDKIKAIKEAIWTHDETPEPMSGNDIPRMLDKIANQKHDKGIEKGKTVGEAQGRDAQYNEFWDKYLDNVMNGGNANYMFAGSCWNSETFFPPATTIKLKDSADGMFNRFSWWKEPHLDLARRLEECGCELDFSESTNPAGGTFTYCFVTRLPKLDFSSSTSTMLDRTFDGAAQLVTIDELVMPTKEVTFPNTFRKCSNLKNIVITGMIANSIDFSACSELTSASVDSIIAALKQLSDGDGARTVTFHATVKANMTETQIAAIDEKG
jgi:hypothetical protein